MTETLRPPPEGLLLAAAAERQGLSGRMVAARTEVSAAVAKKLGYSKRKLSEPWWRCIIKGFQSVNRTKVAYRGTGETVARFAHAVGATAEDLTAAGRADAADAVRALAAVLALEEKERRDTAAARRISGNPARVEERWLMLEPVLRQAPVGLDPSDRDDLRGRIDGLLAESPQWQPVDGDEDAPPPRAAAAQRKRTKRG
ncbi:hypothetical protein AB0399_28615 [Streptomyces sp. NPDC088194]|uniref:hypothetical protein n=1 Tax=Streptomyces sp. NPDC088194 TaxID=3154931 RepID=UPI00345007FE